MILWSYTLVSSDDCDVLPNALNSLVKIPVDKILVIDGGLGHVLVSRMRNWTPVDEWLQSRPEYRDGKWNGVPLELISNPLVHPAQARNDALRWINDQPNKPDWVIALDSDEIASDEMIAQCRPLLEGTPIEVTNYVQPLLNLLQDEQHCAGGIHSGWLSHARVHRPDAVRFEGNWHEHQVFRGRRMSWTARIVHTRMLFRRRLYYQRNTPTVREAWKDVQMTDVPSDVHWTPIIWPQDERIVPFLADIRER